MLDIDWDYPIEVASVVRDERTYAEVERRSFTREEAFRKLAGDDPRPLLVLRECFVCEGTDRALLTAGKDNARTLLLARWFHCVKVPPDTGEESTSPFHALFGGEEATHLFASRWDGTGYAPLGKATSRTSLWRLMSDVLRSEYEEDPRKRRKKIAALLDDYDRLDLRLDAEEARRARLIETYGENARGLHRVDAKLEELQAELAELDERVAELSELTLRRAEPTDDAPAADAADGEAQEAGADVAVVEASEAREREPRDRDRADERRRDRPSRRQRDFERTDENTPSEVDPYTRAQAKYLERAGYRSFGPFAWLPGASSDSVAEQLGNLPMLWIETDHFLLGTDLGPYRVATDQAERTKVEDELRRLKSAVWRVKPNVNELDRWLRIHLWAQRLEELHRTVTDELGLEGDVVDSGDKLRVLLFAEESSLARYLRRYHGVRTDDPDSEWDERPFRSWAPSVSRERTEGTEVPILCLAESLQDDYYANDTAVHCAVAFEIVQCLLESALGREKVPTWFAQGLGHVFARRIDRRYNVRGNDRVEADFDAWEWAERVRGRVLNHAVPSAATTLAWASEEDLEDADHMVLWSRLDFLTQEHGKDLPRFVRALANAPTEAPPADVQTHQERALDTCLGIEGPEDFDRAWKRWVRYRYR